MVKVRLKSEQCGAVDEVEIERAGEAHPGHYVLHWRQEQAHVEYLRTGQSGGLLKWHGEVHPFLARRSGETIQVWMDGRVHTFELLRPTAQRAGGVQTEMVHEALTAPMPGTVIKIEVTPGQTFEARQTLMVMESMKMEMNLSVPHAGRIKRIRCSAGQKVELGAVLADLEPTSE